eukprot:35985-Prymnesium_polylepis.1
MLGKGARPGDGWDNEKDMPDGVINEAGGRARRNKNEKGGIMSSQAYRDVQMAEGKTAEDKTAMVRAAIFKAWRSDAWVLSMNALMEPKLLSGEKLTTDEMIGFIRARTNKAVPQGQKRVAQLTEAVEALRGKPVVVRSTLQPDGYDAWLAVECAKAAEKAAAKATANPTTAMGAAAANPTTAMGAATAVAGVPRATLDTAPAATGTDNESESDEDDSGEKDDEADEAAARCWGSYNV